MEVKVFIQFSIFGLIILFGNCFGYDPATCIQCRESHMCNPPECFCCRDKMPLQTHTIPQMVFFTFDDAVNPQVASYYRELFSPKRRNPNGCPISMTLFVSHRNTVYSLVKEFYQKGMEIASHSVTHSHMNANTFIREARKQKENLSKRAGIPSSKITGWRSPFLEPVGDLQPSVLKDLGYEYDATLTVAKKDPKDKAVTPFTLDFGWPYDCKIKPCPAKSHKGFWEVPVVSVKDYLDKYDCVYVDGCNNPPPTERLAYQFLWDNFQKYYTTNRAPMGINMHASWFYYPDRKAAMNKFIKELGKLDDVYIVSVKQVIEWLRHPTSLSKIKTFQPWQCNGNVTSSLQPSITNFDNRPQRQRTRGSTFRPKSTRIGNFISNVPQPTFPSRNWQTPRPQRRQPLVPNTMPTPVPPMVPNLPMVRFWWRPPNLGDATRQRNMQIQEQQRQQSLRRRRMEEERMRRIQADNQARLREQKQQEELRQQELARQAELLKRQNEMERKRLNDMQLRRRRIQERERQRLLEAEQQKKAEERRINELKRNEATKQNRLGRQRQVMIRPQRVASIENLHQSEFLQLSEADNHRARAPSELQTPVPKLQKFQRDGKQLQNEIARHSLTQTPPTTTINHQKVLEKSFEKFISMKLDQILGHRPTERTKQLEMLSITELRALQEELRNRLLTDNQTPRQHQNQPAQAVEGRSSAVSQREVSPIQNQIQPESKPFLNEFHTPTQVQRTKISDFQTEEIVKQDTLKNYNEQFLDPVISEPIQASPEVQQQEPKEQLIDSLKTTITQQVTITTSTKAAPVATKVTTTERPTPRTTTTLPTTQSTSALPSTTTSTTLQPTTTTRTTTTTTTTEVNTPTSTLFTSTPEVTLSTAKARIPVVQRWTVSKNIRMPWQRWMTERPIVVTTKHQTTTPETRETKSPAEIETFAIRNMKKTQSLFSIKSRHPLLPDSNNKLNTDLMKDHVTEIKQQPKAFVNDPAHFNIHYDINGQHQSGLIPGIGFNFNRFSSPVNQKLRSLHIFSPETVEETTSTISPQVQHETTKPPPSSTTTTETTTTTTTTTSAPKVTSKGKNISQSVNSQLSNKTLQEGRAQGQLGIKEKVLAPDTNAYIVTGNLSETVLPNMVQHSVEFLPPSNQPVHVSMHDWQLSKSSKCLQEINCFRPDCVCRETNPPKGMLLADTPQIVYITIDGSLNFHTYGKMRALFSRSRKNPNGCRIKGTVFVTDTGSSYRIANVLRNDGVEIGMMGVSSRPYKDSEKLKQDLILQRKRISTNADTNTAFDDVKGWRSPGFQPVGDGQFNTMANNSLYDSSIMLRADAKDMPLLWPYTLDYGWKETCEKGTCPQERHRGVWEVPSIPFTGPKNTTACEYVDACTLQPETKQETVDFLLDNFYAYYKTNRAPFAIRLKQMWFHWYYRDNFEGLLMFLDKILGLGDVYITSVSDTIEWMKSPKSLTEVKQFEKWKC